MSGAAIAQDWQDLDAERAPSNFDQRHLLTAQFQYTTGVGVAGGALLDGIKGSLFKGWTFTSPLTTGSGLPLTPTYLTSVPGTGVTGTIRADLTGAPVDDAPDGFYLNPAAYTAPAAGSGEAPAGTRYRARAVRPERRPHADVPRGRPAQSRLAA